MIASFAVKDTYNMFSKLQRLWNQQVYMCPRESLYKKATSLLAYKYKVFEVGTATPSIAKEICIPQQESDMV